MRIALTHVHCWPQVRRGGERWLHEAAAALARAGNDVTIVSTAPRPGRARQEDVRVVRLPRPPGAGLIQELRFGREVLPALLGARFDVVHSLGVPDAAASVAAARLRRRRRTVFTNLGNPDRAYYESLATDAVGRRLVAQHERVVREIDVYGCLSGYAAAKLEADFGRRAAITSGGVSIRRFWPCATRSATPSLLYAGSLDEPRKGVAVLLDALDIVVAKEPAARLLLTGPGEVSPLLERAPAGVRDCVDVLPLGTPDLAPVYSSAWATVLPSVHEAFGLSLLESLACGTPIVGADHAALPELVQPDLGVLARPDDAVSLAEACLQAFELARRPDIAGRCRSAAERYDWDTAVAPALMALYER